MTCLNYEMIKYLERDPIAYELWRMTGKLPKLEPHHSPLTRLLEKMSVYDRLTIQRVRLDHKLGYRTNRMFNNANTLLQWLKPIGSCKRKHNRLLICSLKKPITVKMLIDNAQRV